MKRIVFFLLGLFLCTSILLVEDLFAAAGDRKAPTAPPDDSRFFGAYYGSFSTTICKRYRVKFLWFKSKIRQKCENVEVNNIQLHLDYQYSPAGGVMSGIGEGTFKGNKIPISVAGKVVKKGKAWGMVSLMLPKFRTERGYTSLSNDGLELSIPILGDKTIVLRKDAGSNTKPQVTITTPGLANRMSLEFGTTQVFSAAVADAQQQSFPKERLVWKSDRDGIFDDKGLTVYNSSLSPGKHKITFEATDDGGLTGKAEIEIYVQNNSPNKPQIIQPLAAAKIYASSPVLFQGKAFDIEDGWLEGNALSWSSNKDGFLGNGASLYARLKTPGSHLIRLTAFDQNKLSNFTENSIAVQEYNGNSPPQVSIDIPKHMAYEGIAIQSGQEISFQGTAKDYEDPFDKLVLEWRDAEVTTGKFNLAPTLIGVGDKAKYKFTGTTVPTAHIISFSAKDSGGLVGKASMKIVVMPWTIK